MTGRQLYVAIVVGGLASLAFQSAVSIAWATLQERRARR